MAKETITHEKSHSTPSWRALINYLFEDTLMQISKSANILVFIWKYFVEDFTLKHLLRFEMRPREICEKFVYKHSEAIKYVKN